MGVSIAVQKGVQELRYKLNKLHDELLDELVVCETLFLMQRLFSSSKMLEELTVYSCLSHTSGHENSKHSFSINLSRFLQSVSLRAMEGRIATLEQSLEQQSTILGDIMKLLKEQEQTRVNNQNLQNNHDNGGTLQQGMRNSLKFTPKVDFPSFDGTNPRIWMKKCLKYFNLCKIPDNQRVDLASMYMTGRAESWFNSYVVVRPTVDWNDFIVDLCARFKEEIAGNVVEEFNKLRQTGSIDDYLDAFENLKGLMMQRNPLLPEQYFLDSFIGGLKPSLKPFVRAFKPTTLASVIEYARLQEETLIATRTSVKPNPQFTHNIPKTFPLNNSFTPKTFPGKGLLPTPGSSTVKSQPQMTSHTQKPTRFISAAERAEKHKKGECYFCNEPYSREHVCKFKGTQLFAIEIVGDEEEDVVEMHGNEEEEDTEVVYDMSTSEPCISVNALSGCTGFQTMRVTGYVGKTAVHILIDSGSTHNFLDQNMAMKLGCKLDKIVPQAVTVADGSQFPCQLMSRKFSWQLLNTHFETDALIIPLGGCDMVLGIQWLSTLGTVSWNFKQLKMEFMYNKRKHVLRGLAPQKIKTMVGGPSCKMIETAAHLCFLKINTIASEGSNILCCSNGVRSMGDYPPELRQLLQGYKDIFEEPTTLPPQRGVYDHRIPLMTDAQPVNIRPYRYPLKQRDTIERLVQEMMDQGIIQPSCSPFASPVVLVGKKDGTWRLCVDYRELNKRTVKDKFPIPVVDELIDELAGSRVFTKLDLRAGYHQLRVYEGDVFKTAFKTHVGHYEFLVMPFGLTNAPASFQNWMNNIFKPLLRKCVLVFFDDILVYSSSLMEHWQHLNAVFELMRQNKLYAKSTKCAFAINKVEYLGHFISGVGVETDQAKVVAVAQWPEPKNVKELRSFLGLAGYYRKFVKGYAVISQPLTQLLRKGEFKWDNSAFRAFQALKTALTSAPVLALPDFNKLFVVETDASNNGIGAVLMQEGHPLAFISKTLSPKWQKLSVYEKELLAIVFAVQKWEQYLTGQKFIIKTDQKSLKWLLQQKISTPFQQFWLSKLMGFDYEIQYRAGKENLAADALSRVSGSDLMSLTLSDAQTDLSELIQKSYEVDIFWHNLVEQLKTDPVSVPAYQLSNGFVLKKGRIVVGPDTSVRERILQWLHSAPQSGHSGRDATTRRVKSLFVWKGMTKDISHFIRNCTICQANKYDQSAYPGLLQPLPIPSEVWLDISMDFITWFA
ncbi:uncharacterized protein LOC141595557 [Silene latifolia]|uniref:uncharacterized protein LOC141595557 n=1 Tax=Silene latifolia TaxID=37657 RepID=UPI003D783509